MTSSGPRSPARRTTPRKPPGSTRSDDGVTPPRVGAHIQRLRNERKMTLEDLSRAAGVSKSMLSDIERDKANPTIAVTWRLTNALGVNLDRLFASASHDADPIQVAGPHDIPTLSGTDAKYQLRVWGPIELAHTPSATPARAKPQRCWSSYTHNDGNAGPSTSASHGHSSPIKLPPFP